MHFTIRARSVLRTCTFTHLHDLTSSLSPAHTLHVKHHHIKLARHTHTHTHTPHLLVAALARRLTCNTYGHFFYTRSSRARFARCSLLAAMPRKMQVLSLGMPRTGSASLAEAYSILGYVGVFHGIKVLSDDAVFRKIGRAADATFPNLPSYTGKPFSRGDWEDLYGEYEVSTDMASFFTPQLIATYPDAKVVLVKREFDAWFKSLDDGLLKPTGAAMTQFHIKYTEPLAGLATASAGQKCLLGYFQAKNMDEIRVNARRIYDEHYATIEKLVPKERLLMYDFKDGWGPLCAFLDKPVPDVPFPRVNESAAIQAAIKAKVLNDAKGAAPVLVKWLLILASFAMSAAALSVSLRK